MPWGLATQASRTDLISCYRQMGSVPATAEGGAGVKSTRERAEEKRQAKLELVQEQVESGSLVIRKMTAEERRQYPPRETPPKKDGRR